MSKQSAQHTPFTIWRRQHTGGEWLKTAHSVTARTYDEAQWKTGRKFRNARFSSMSLIALPLGESPNAKTWSAA